MQIKHLVLNISKMPLGGGGGVLPYMAYTQMCRWTGYGFRPLCPKQGIQFRASLSSLS